MNPIDKYISEFSSPENDLLKDLTRTTYLKTIHPQMLSGHVQGKFLEMIVRMLRPKRVLEIGTFTGYSTLSMAAGLDEDACIDTIEADDELQPIIQSHFDRSPYGHKIHLHIGTALKIVPQLGQQYDLVFVDGDKREYPAYYEMLINGCGTPDNRPLVKAGSFILADNILWYGKVADPDKYSDPHTRAIVEFNRRVLENPHLQNVILPLRDGINLIRVVDIP